VYPIPSTEGMNSTKKQQANGKKKVSPKDKALRQAQSMAAKRRNKLAQNRRSPDPCTIEYAESLIDPYRKDLAPCVPSGIALRSQKVCVFSEGSFLTGTAGWGGITIYGALCNNATATTCTTATYSGFGLPTLGDAGTFNTGFTNSPFSTIDLAANSGVELRLCSLGVRVRYVGTELNRGGLRYAIQHPEHLSVEGLTAPDIAAFDFRQIDNQTRDWTSVVYTPLRHADYSFTDNPSGFSTNVPVLGILCESASTAIICPFEFQVVAHYEAIGAKARGKTVSNSDINGTLKALSAVSQGPPGLSTAVSNHKTNSRMIAEKAVTKGSDMWGDIAVKVGSALGSYAAEAGLAMLL